LRRQRARAESRFTDLERPPLNEAVLRRALLGGDSLWHSLDVVASTGSTNDDLVEQARIGAEEGVVRIAEEQTSGHGRLDRMWTAPIRSGLTFSVLLRPGTEPLVVPLSRWGLAGLLTGVALAEALTSVAEVDVVLKWPNDLLVDNRKLGGILAELCETPAGPALVVGMGINVTLRAEELPVPNATSLALEGAACLDRDTLLRAALRSLEKWYTLWRLDRGAPDSFMPTYRERCATLGNEVSVALPSGRTLNGVATGIDDDGQLVVTQADATESMVSAGDVVHVRPA
jgi:BirA family biotin operon repressor/biotin-[acetyl-CoA-carboxylase] ligase